MDRMSVRAFLAIITVLGLFTVIGLLFFRTVDPASRTVLNVLLGLLGGTMTSITSFYFGSSEEKKTRLN